MKIDKERGAKLEEFCQAINVRFEDRYLLNLSLTHSSYAYETGRKMSEGNERLEFLGDVALSLAVSEYLFNLYPDRAEGELAKIRATIVSKPALSKRARIINLGDYILLGKGEEVTGGRERDSILADAFEAVIGAIYLDSGLKGASQFVLSQLKEEIELIEHGEHNKDYKTDLQETTQNMFKTLPDYEVSKIEGPDHDRTFEVKTLIQGKFYGAGSGKSKKEAQQKAAKKTLEKLRKNKFKKR